MSEAVPLILVVDDEQPIRRFLRATLAASRYEITEAATGAEGLWAAAQRPPDLVILDLGLPDMDGLEVTRRLREWSAVPIVVLSARGQEHDKVAALDAGADDYLTKPFGVDELKARIRVALRHAAHATATQADAVLETRGLRVDLSQRQVWVNGTEMHLTPIEYKLLSVLVRNAGKVVTHRHLLREVWGPAYEAETQYVRVYLAQLRHKLERDPTRPRYLLTEPGVGYRLRIDGGSEG